MLLKIKGIARSGCDGGLQCYLRCSLFIPQVTGDFASAVKDLILCYLCVVFSKLVVISHTDPWNLTNAGLEMILGNDLRVGMVTQ
jgi:hypothetical protein